MKREQIKQLLKLSMPIILSTFLILGVSYAWFTLTLRGTKEQVLHSGTLSLVLNDASGNGISLLKGQPIYDEEGVTLTPYTFTLTNNGTVDSDYTIYLDDVTLESGEVRLPDSVIKYNLVKDNQSVATELLSTTGVSPNRVLDTGSIAPGDSYSYELRLWLDENMTNTNMGKTFRGKIRVEASQVIEPIPTN